MRPSRILTPVLLLSLASCCKAPIGQRLNTAEAENAHLKFELDATRQANQAARDYAAELKGDVASAPTFSVTYAVNDLALLSQSSLPYKIDAHEFNNDLSGEIVIDRVYDYAFQAGNRMTCMLRLHGERIEYHGNVPSMYQGMVNDFKTGIAAGVIADMDVSLGFQGHEVRALARVLAAHMQQNGSALFENNLRDQMNSQAFRDPIAFDVRINGTSALIKRLVVTQRHIVIGYTGI